MDSAHWEKIQRLFAEAVELPAAAREAFLRDLERADAAAHEEVASLLDADQRNEALVAPSSIAAAAAALEPGLEGERAGPYLVEAEIGRGAMGAVYRAVDTRLERRVALKFLAGSNAATEKARVRFYSEARVVSRLDHPNICTIFDIGETRKGDLYFAMAYYEGQTLARRLKRSPVPLRDAVEWARQTAHALHYAHERGVVHRDIKAANVFLTAANQVKILDFGIAKLEGVDFTDTGFRIGTVAYMSPERLLGANADPRGDIWSFGVLFHELLTGHKPFDGESSDEIANRILRTEAGPITAKVDWLPPLVDRIAERCLSREIDARYETAAELGRDLDSLRSLLEADAGLASRLVGGGSAATRTRDLTHFSEVESRHVTIVSAKLHRADDEARAATDEYEAELALALQHRAESYALSEGFSFVPSIESLITLCVGYPRSMEDNATRALRAAVALRDDLREAIRARAGSESGYSVTFGVHSGNVIVDGTGQTSTGVLQHLQGDVHLIAYRMQRLAGPGEIVVSQPTVNLLRGRFAMETAGVLDAGRANIRVHRLTEHGGEPAGRATEHPADRALVGRASERSILAESWQAVLDGEGKIVAIRGEAGIGKSRLARYATHELGASASLLLQGSAYHQNSFLYPVKEWLRGELGTSGAAARAAGQAAGDGAALESLSAYLAAHGLADARTLRVVAKLLDIDAAGAPEDRALALASPEMRRQYTLQAIVALIACKAGREPLLIVAEDLHWADASTLELIQRLVDQGPVSRFLLLLSFRPQFSAEWLGRAHVLQLTLGKLGVDQSTALAAACLEGADIPAGLLERIVGKTDGVPLFIEELCSMLSENLAAGGDDGRLVELTVPDTLRDSLSARLDQNADYKPIAQLGAVLGREFEYRMVAGIWTGEPRVLDVGLAHLVESELLFQRGSIPDATFVFKHALIQDAAYASLVGTTRAVYHRLAADVIERSFQEVAAQHPEVLAVHRSRAGQAERAAPHWLAAAAAALQQSALAEAISHARAGLAELAALAEGPQKAQLELQLLMTLGPALMAHHSWSAPDVERSYERARQICAELGNAPELFPVLYGLYTYHCVVANHETGESLNALCLRVAQEAGDEGLLLEAHMLKGMTHFFYGELGPAREYLERSVTRYDPEEFGGHCYLYGQDPGMVASSYLALTLAFAGEARRAVAVSSRSLEQTRALGHPFSLAYALCFAAWLHLDLGDTERGAALAEEALALCQEQRIGIMLGMSQVMIGWTRLQRGRHAEAAEMIGSGLAHFESVGANVLMPLWHALAALAAAGSGEPEHALELVERGVRIASRTREHWSRAELLRVEALLLARCGERPERVRAALREAAEQAAAQGAMLFEHRALKALVEGRYGDDSDAARLATLARRVDTAAPAGRP